MKAFVSYSVTDNNEYILTLLSAKLRERNFVVNTSQNFYANVLDFNTMNEIRDSHLFIAIITGMGNERLRVLKEWEYSVAMNIPNLLLIENTVPLNQGFTGNYILFDRFNPNPAIEEINRRTGLSQPVPLKSNNDALPWILGGAALIAIIALLAGDSKK